MAKTNYIDLGLPSGTKWADKNVGAESPTDSGLFLAWGETEEKDSYYLSNYKHYGVVSENEQTITTEDGEKVISTPSYGYTKYNAVDGKTRLDSEDAPCVIPTKEQWEELLGNTSCTIADGIATFKADNGDSISIPLCGCKHENMECGSHWGEYWSADLTENEANAYRVIISNEVGNIVNAQWRIIGMQIRGVKNV